MGTDYQIEYIRQKVVSGTLFEPDGQQVVGISNARVQWFGYRVVDIPRTTCNRGKISFAKIPSSKDKTGLTLASLSANECWMPAFTFH